MINEQELKQLHDKIAGLEETVVHQRARADRAETFICTMCAECKWEENDGMLIMQKSCGHLFPLNCNKFKLRSLWIPVTERLPEEEELVLIVCKNGARFVGYCGKQYYDLERRWRIKTALNSTKLLNKGRVTHWMPLPEPPKEVE
jgi:hypothetical protein